MNITIVTCFIHLVTKSHDPPSAIWEFPKIRGTLFWGPYNRDPII